MSTLPSTRYYYINLDRAQERRRSAEQQAKDFGLHLERIEAIHGSDLSPEIVQSLGFKEKKRLREHAAPLTMNEHGCLHSHLKTLRAFLETDADFGVVLEDDFVLADDFAEGMAWLTQKTGGWEVCKLSGGGSLKPYLHIPPPGVYRLPTGLSLQNHLRGNWFLLYPPRGKDGAR